MKITNVQVEGFQGINWLNLSIRTPILLVSGANNSGKSSLVNAISFAVTGNTERVKLKKDYTQLVHDGFDGKKAFVRVATDGGIFNRSVATGKVLNTVEDADPPFLFPYLDGTTKYANLDRKQRQELITETTGAKADRAAVVQMMVQRGISDEAIEMTLPLLRSGFEAAHTKAKAMQSECRGAWSATTGENYGSLKAETWVWTPPAQDLAGIAKLEKSIAETKSDIADTTVKLDDIRKKVAAADHNQGTKTQCPCCKEWLWFKGGIATKHVENQTTPDTFKRLADTYARGEARIHDLKGKLAQFEAELRVLSGVTLVDEKTGQAKKYHELAQGWEKVADALSPNGIPLQITNMLIAPLNEHLDNTAKITGWARVVIQADLELTVGGRAYGLLSESEKWRADIAMSEMISAISGVKVFISDRFDVLSLANRSKCLAWLMEVSKNHDTIIILGTLKALPTGLPAEVSALWLEYGKQQEAAL